MTKSKNIYMIGGAIFQQIYMIVGAIFTQKQHYLFIPLND